jgi:hypothetical protein
LSGPQKVCERLVDLGVGGVRLQAEFLGYIGFGCRRLQAQLFQDFQSL